MSNAKKYVSLDKLGFYDEQIKKYITNADTTALNEAKAYSDSLAENYEPSGSIKTAKEELQTNIDLAQAAADSAQATAEQAQTKVGNLETYVGTMPEATTATSIVEYINEKTTGIVTDLALTELTERVNKVEDDVEAISGNYLTSDDKSELNDIIAGEVARAQAAEKANADAVKAISDNYLKSSDKTELQESIDSVAGDVATIKGNYLKSADKTELQSNIDAKVSKTDFYAEVERISGVETSLQNQINTILSNPDTKDIVDSISEFTNYIEEHGEIAEGFRTDINTNKTAISDMDTAYKAADADLSARLDVLEDIDYDYASADTALENKLTTEINKKASQEALDLAIETLEGADSDLADRLVIIENKFDGESSIENTITEAVQAAANAASAAEAASKKAEDAETNAKSYADGLNTDTNARIDALELVGHTHSNKSELDLIVSGDKNKWDNAATIAHEHNNFAILEGINDTKITAWNSAEANAKGYADGLNTEMNNRVTTIETWKSNFLECSEEEIIALFETTNPQA